MFILGTYFKRDCNISFLLILQLPTDPIDPTSLQPDDEGKSTIPVGRDAVSVIVTYALNDDNGEVKPISVKACTKPGTSQFLTLYRRKTCTELLGFYH